MKVKRRQIRCERPECGALFEGPIRNYPQFRDLFVQNGWRMRGTVTGPVYLCPKHW